MYVHMYMCHIGDCVSVHIHLRTYSIYYMTCYAACLVGWFVQDLCDKLWDICDERKREAGEEKTRISTERWLEDRIGVLCNYFFLLIQVSLYTCAHSLVCSVVTVCVHHFH